MCVLCAATYDTSYYYQNVTHSNAEGGGTPAFEAVAGGDTVIAVSEQTSSYTTQSTYCGWLIQHSYTDYCPLFLALLEPLLWYVLQRLA